MKTESTDVELTQDEIIALIEKGARERRGVTARELVEAYREGRLEEPGRVLDLLTFAAMLDKEHPLHVEPQHGARGHRPH